MQKSSSEASLPLYGSPKKKSGASDILSLLASSKSRASAKPGFDIIKSKKSYKRVSKDFDLLLQDSAEALNEAIDAVPDPAKPLMYLLRLPRIQASLKFLLSRGRWFAIKMAFQRLQEVTACFVHMVKRVQLWIRRKKAISALFVVSGTDGEGGRKFNFTAVTVMKNNMATVIQCLVRIFLAGKAVARQEVFMYHYRRHKAMITVQRCFRGYLIRGRIIIIYKNKLLHLLREFAQGSIFKLLERPILQDIEHQMVIRNAIFVACFPSKPIKLVPSLAMVKGYIKNVNALRDRCNRDASTLLHEDGNRRRDREDMLQADHYSKMAACVYEYSMATEAAERQRLEDIKQRLVYEEMKRWQRRNAMSVMAHFSLEENNQRVEREYMFLEENQTRRYNYSIQLGAENELKYNRELMTFEDKRETHRREAQLSIEYEKRALEMNEKAVKAVKRKGVSRDEALHKQDFSLFTSLASLNVFANMLPWWATDQESLDTQQERKRGVKHVVQEVLSDNTIATQSLTVLHLPSKDTIKSKDKKKDKGSPSLLRKVHKRNKANISASNGTSPIPSGRSNPSIVESDTVRSKQSHMSGPNPSNGVFARKYEMISKHRDGLLPSDKEIDKDVKEKEAKKYSNITTARSSDDENGGKDLRDSSDFAIKCDYFLDAYTRERKQQLSYLKALRKERLDKSQEFLDYKARFIGMFNNLCNERNRLKKTHFVTKNERSKQLAKIEQMEYELPALRAQMIRYGRCIGDVYKRELKALLEMVVPNEGIDMEKEAYDFEQRVSKAKRIEEKRARVEFYNANNSSKSRPRSRPGSSSEKGAERGVSDHISNMNTVAATMETRAFGSIPVDDVIGSDRLLAANCNYKRLSLLGGTPEAWESVDGSDNNTNSNDNKDNKSGDSSKGGDGSTKNGLYEQRKSWWGDDIATLCDSYAIFHPSAYLYGKYPASFPPETSNHNEFSIYYDAKDTRRFIDKLKGKGQLKTMGGAGSGRGYFVQRKATSKGKGKDKDAFSVVEMQMPQGAPKTSGKDRKHFLGNIKGHSLFTFPRADEYDFVGWGERIFSWMARVNEWIYRVEECWRVDNKSDVIACLQRLAWLETSSNEASQQRYSKAFHSYAKSTTLPIANEHREPHRFMVSLDTMVAGRDYISATDAQCSQQANSVSVLDLMELLLCRINVLVQVKKKRDITSNGNGGSTSNGDHNEEEDVLCSTILSWRDSQRLLGVHPYSHIALFLLQNRLTGGSRRYLNLQYAYQYDHLHDVALNGSVANPITNYNLFGNNRAFLLLLKAVSLLFGCDSDDLEAEEQEVDMTLKRSSFGSRGSSRGSSRGASGGGSRPSSKSGRMRRSGLQLVRKSESTTIEEDRQTDTPSSKDKGAGAGDSEKTSVDSPTEGAAGITATITNDGDKVASSKKTKPLLTIDTACSPGEGEVGEREDHFDESVISPTYSTRSPKRSGTPSNTFRAIKSPSNKDDGTGSNSSSAAATPTRSTIVERKEGTSDTPITVDSRDREREREDSNAGTERFLPIPIAGSLNIGPVGVYLDYLDTASIVMGIAGDSDSNNNSHSHSSSRAMSPSNVGRPISRQSLGSAGSATSVGLGGLGAETPLVTEPLTDNETDAENENNSIGSRASSPDKERLNPVRSRSRTSIKGPATLSSVTLGTEKREKGDRSVSPCFRESGKKEARPDPRSSDTSNTNATTTDATKRSNKTSSRKSRINARSTTPTKQGGNCNEFEEAIFDFEILKKRKILQKAKLLLKTSVPLHSDHYIHSLYNNMDGSTDRRGFHQSTKNSGNSYIDDPSPSFFLPMHGADKLQRYIREEQCCTQDYVRRLMKLGYLYIEEQEKEEAEIELPVPKSNNNDGGNDTNVVPMNFSKILFYDKDEHAATATTTVAASDNNNDNHQDVIESGPMHRRDYGRHKYILRLISTELRAPLFINTSITMENWTVSLPRWMRPVAHSGAPAGGEPFWRRLALEARRGEKGAYTKANELDETVDRVARRFFYQMKRRLLLAEEDKDAFMAPVRHRVENASMGWEDALMQCIHISERERRYRIARIGKKDKEGKENEEGQVDETGLVTKPMATLRDLPKRSWLSFFIGCTNSMKIFPHIPTLYDKYFDVVAIPPPDQIIPMRNIAYLADGELPRGVVKDYSRLTKGMRMMLTAVEIFSAKLRRKTSWITGEEVHIDESGQHKTLTSPGKHNNVSRPSSRDAKEMWPKVPEIWTCGGVRDGVVSIMRVVDDEEEVPRGGAVIEVNSGTAASYLRTGFAGKRLLCDDDRRRYADFLVTRQGKSTLPSISMTIAATHGTADAPPSQHGLTISVGETAADGFVSNINDVSTSNDGVMRPMSIAAMQRCRIRASASSTATISVGSKKKSKKESKMKLKMTGDASSLPSSPTNSSRPGSPTRAGSPTGIDLPSPAKGTATVDTLVPDASGLITRVTEVPMADIMYTRMAREVYFSRHAWLDSLQVISKVQGIIRIRQAKRRIELLRASFHERMKERMLARTYHFGLLMYLREDSRQTHQHKATQVRFMKNDGLYIHWSNMNYVKAIMEVYEFSTALDFLRELRGQVETIMESDTISLAGENAPLKDVQKEFGSLLLCDIYLHMAYCLFQCCRYAEVFGYIDMYLKHTQQIHGQGYHNSHSTAILLKARCLHQQGQYEGAQQVLQDLIASQIEYSTSDKCREDSSKKVQESAISSKNNCRDLYMNEINSDARLVYDRIRALLELGALYHSLGSYIEANAVREEAIVLYDDNTSLVQGTDKEYLDTLFISLEADLEQVKGEGGHSFMVSMDNILHRMVQLYPKDRLYSDEPEVAALLGDKSILYYHPQMAPILARKALALIQHGYLLAAQLIVALQSQICSAFHSREHASYADSCYVEAVYLSRIGQYSEAMAKIEIAEKVYFAVYGDNSEHRDEEGNVLKQETPVHDSIAKCFYLSAEIKRIQGMPIRAAVDYDKALQLYLSIYKEYNPQKHNEVLIVYYGIAMNHLCAHRYQQTCTAFEELIEMYQHLYKDLDIETHILLEKCHLHYAAALIGIGYHSDAKTILGAVGKKLVAMSHNGNEDVHVADGLYYFAQIRIHEGKYSYASDLLRRCLSIKEGTGGEEGRQELAHIYLLMANNYGHVGYFDKATEYLDIADDILKPLVPENSMHLVQVLHLRGILMKNSVKETHRKLDPSEAKKVKRAIRFYKQAMHIVRQQLGEHCLLYGRIKGDYGDCLRIGRYFREAGETITNSIQIVHHDGQEANVLSADLMRYLAMYNIDLDTFHSYNLALQILDNHVVPVYDRHLPEDHPKAVFTKGLIGMTGKHGATTPEHSTRDRDVLDTERMLPQDLIDYALDTLQEYKYGAFHSNHSYVRYLSAEQGFLEPLSEESSPVDKDGHYDFHLDDNNDNDGNDGDNLYDESNGDGNDDDDNDDNENNEGYMDDDMDDEENEEEVTIMTADTSVGF